jgi:hypothetical protein
MAVFILSVALGSRINGAVEQYVFLLREFGLAFYQAAAREGCLRTTCENELFAPLQCSRGWPK